MLDLFLLRDPRTPELARAIRTDELQWLTTARMREECRRVLNYLHLQQVAQRKGVNADVEKIGQIRIVASAV